MCVCVSRYFLCRHNHGLVTVLLLFVCAYMHSDTLVAVSGLGQMYGSLLVTKMSEVEITLQAQMQCCFFIFAVLSINSGHRDTVSKL